MNSTKIELLKNYSTFYRISCSCTCDYYTLCILLTEVFIQIHSMFRQEVSHHFIVEKITANWILYIRSIDFPRRVSARKFYVFITIATDSRSLSKLLYDTNKMNNILKFINTDISDFVWKDFYCVSNSYLA